VKTRAVALALVLAPAFLPAQTGGVVGVVVAKATGEPLAYSIVGLDSLERSAFASDSGRFGIREIRVGQHLIRVRRLGYTPRDVSIFIREGMTDTLRVELDRVVDGLTASELDVGIVRDGDATIQIQEPLGRRGARRAQGERETGDSGRQTQPPDSSHGKLLPFC